MEVLMFKHIPTGVDLDRLRDVSRGHDWPEGDYRKEECMKRAKEVWAEV
jgi:hypothetical protein